MGFCNGLMEHEKLVFGCSAGLHYVYKQTEVAVHLKNQNISGNDTGLSFVRK